MGGDDMGMSDVFVSLVRRHAPRNAKAVSLGYPDYMPEPRNRQPSEFLWREVGADLLVIDYKKLRGMEEVVDLNAPLPERLCGGFDLLINPGTFEHVFNVGQAMANGYRLLRPGGIGVHTGPIARGRHGFWNYNENTFSAFYAANGGEVIDQRREGQVLFVVTRNGPAAGEVVWPHERRES